MKENEKHLLLEDRIVQVLKHLGAEKAHFAARMPSDWEGLIINYPEAISSLTVFCQALLNPNPLQNISSRLLIVFGDQFAKELHQPLTALVGAEQIALTDYESNLWDDIIFDRGDEIGTAILEFMEKTDLEQRPNTISPSELSGEVAGITYEIQGSGPLLVLLPLGLAPSQWDHLLPKLSEHYCTIVLGGPELGVIPSLEARGRSAGYQRVLRNMMDEVQLQPGENILDVGCGTGVINRWLAYQTDGLNQIVGVDINRYLLQEAAALVRMEGLETIIDFREGNAENLPFNDNEFDLTLSSTVMEEVDAHKMLAEMIRVTKPGGRVGVIVRATDVPWLFNIPLQTVLKEKVENLEALFDEGKGCSSASLYWRFQRSILTNIKMIPQQAVFDDPEGSVEKVVLGIRLSILNPEEAEEWHVGLAKAISEKTFFFTWPHHCAVGTKPG